jgi:hypothetical protein
MDANKLAKLHEIGYSIKNTCSMCSHGVFPNNDWGTCDVFTYDHQKHSDQKRRLSIHKGGSCSKFDLSPAESLKLGMFRELMGD